MDSTARIYPHPGTRFLYAHFSVWDAARQKWKIAGRSTRSTDPAKALEIAREYERLALAAGGPNGATRLSRDFVAGVVEDILRISGHRPVEVVKSWKAHCDAWLAATRKRVPSSLSARSLAAYLTHVKNFNDWLGKRTSMHLTAIDGEMIQSWYDAGRASGLSATTMNSFSTTLHGMFERAKDEGFTTRNPVNLLQRDSGKNTRDPFSLAQMQVVLEHLRQTKQQDWLTVALLAFCTSQRLSDCAAALRSQFEPGNPWWTWNLTQGKTKKPLRIPLVEPVASHVAAILAKKPQSLFMAPSLAVLRAARLSPQFAAILEACGIAGRHVQGTGKGRAFNSLSFHSTRHTCNSLLAQAGVPFEIRKLITGHAGEATNIIYTHLDDATKAKALNKAFKRPKKAS